MSTHRKRQLALTLLSIALIGIAQWFFGNLYEAVVTAPNWRVAFTYELLTGQSQFDAGSPVRYYVPVTQLAIVLLWVASALTWRAVPISRRWLGIASIAGALALVLTIYIVTQLNLRLFFGGTALDVAQATPLMQQWQALNYLRVLLVGTTLLATAAALRLIYRTHVLAQTQPAPSAPGRTCIAPRRR
jgi:hypothetical protein